MSRLLEHLGISLGVFLMITVVEIYNLDAPMKEVLRSYTLPDCLACKALVGSFKKGIERTSRGKFEGGDADWEEKKLGSYMNSEVRLVEIQEGLCMDLQRGQDQCHFLADEHDSILEEWWFKKQHSDPDLEKYLCVETLKHCCPVNHYGSECMPCLGFPDKVCSNNGKCRGSGSRKGNGTCACDGGYAGKLCDVCAETFYEAYRDETKLICTKCHASCANACSQAGPKGCKECAKGFMRNGDQGCIDINECVIDGICKPNEFCVNKDGSHQCLECDHSCEGCTGDGPDMCIKCAPAYTLENNMCIDKRKVDRTSYVNLTRYLTYLGLCIATCIIFQRSLIVASVLGLMVGLYITVSEYMLTAHKMPSGPTTYDLPALL